MALKSQEINVLSIKSYLISKCIEEENFKKKFLKNPKQSLEEELKINLPDVEIKVLEDRVNLIHITLPRDSDSHENSKISDEDITTLSQNSDLEMRVPILKFFLIFKSLKYPNFKKDLITDPIGTLEKELKIRIPDKMEIKVLEDTQGIIHVALPSEQIMKALKEKSEALSDEDLKQIVGGYSPEAFGRDLLRGVMTVGQAFKFITTGSSEAAQHLANSLRSSNWGT